MRTLILRTLCLLLVVHLTENAQAVGEEGKTSTDSGSVQNFLSIRCQPGDKLCEKDRLGFEAIAQLHSQIDDDQDGSLNRAESAEFFRDDLKHEGGSEKFHGSDDLITVYDLWQIWSSSEVYNWTVDDVIHWLTDNVELSQYTAAFRSNLVDGRILPRLATNYLSVAANLGIKNAVHKQKLSVKATDVVLFGPPKVTHSYIKDLILAVSLAAATGVCYFAYIQHRRAQSHVQKLMKDLSSLQTAEDSLSQLQTQLEQAQTAQRRVAGDKENLEKKLEEISHAKAEAERLRHQRETKQEEEFSQLKLADDELVQVRRALYEAERQLEERQHASFGDLQQWLQMTYEVETRYFEEKRVATEQQLHAAKDMCEKIRRQKGKFLGSFRVAHTASLDETDSKIMSVRSALEDIRVELQERTQRWKQIEKICGFNIVTNPGIPFLDNLLRGSTLSLMTDGSMQRGRSQSNFLSTDDTDDEIASVMMNHTMYSSSGSQVGHSGDLRDRRGASAVSTTSSLLQPASLPARRLSPLLPSKLSRSQLLDAHSDDCVVTSSERSNALTSSQSQGVVFDLGGELSVKGDEKTERATTPMMNKSRSEPVQLTPNHPASTGKIERNGGRLPTADSTDTGNDSDSKSSGTEGSRSEDRKKKTPFSKLLHSSKKSL